MKKLIHVTVSHLLVCSLASTSLTLAATAKESSDSTSSSSAQEVQAADQAINFFMLSSLYKSLVVYNYLKASGIKVRLDAPLDSENSSLQITINGFETPITSRDRLEAVLIELASGATVSTLALLDKHKDKLNTDTIDDIISKVDKIISFYETAFGLTYRNKTPSLQASSPPPEWLLRKIKFISLLQNEDERTSPPKILEFWADSFQELFIKMNELDQTEIERLNDLIQNHLKASDDKAKDSLIDKYIQEVLQNKDLHLKGIFTKEKIAYLIKRLKDYGYPHSNNAWSLSTPIQNNQPALEINSALFYLERNDLEYIFPESDSGAIFPLNFITEFSLKTVDIDTLMNLSSTLKKYRNTVKETGKMPDLKSIKGIIEKSSAKTFLATQTKSMVQQVLQRSRAKHLDPKENVSERDNRYTPGSLEDIPLKLVNGTAEFMIERGKSEVNLAFIKHLKESFLAHELRTLLPKTYSTLSHMDESKYSIFIDNIRQSFESDLDDIDQNALTYLKYKISQTKDVQPNSERPFYSLWLNEISALQTVSEEIIFNPSLGRIANSLFSEEVTKDLFGSNELGPNGQQAVQSLAQHKKWMVNFLLNQILDTNNAISYEDLENILNNDISLSIFNLYLVDELNTALKLHITESDQKVKEIKRKTREFLVKSQRFSREVTEIHSKLAQLNSESEEIEEDFYDLKHEEFKTYIDFFRSLSDEAAELYNTALKDASAVPPAIAASPDPDAFSLKTNRLLDQIETVADISYAVRKKKYSLAFTEILRLLLDENAENLIRTELSSGQLKFFLARLKLKDLRELIESGRIGQNPAALSDEELNTLRNSRLAQALLSLRVPAYDPESGARTYVWLKDDLTETLDILIQDSRLSPDVKHDSLDPVLLVKCWWLIAGPRGEADLEFQFPPENEKLSHEDVKRFLIRSHLFEPSQLQVFIKYTNFFSSLLEAKSDAEVQKAIESIALPTGSSSIKKSGPSKLSILDIELGGYLGGLAAAPAFTTVSSSPWAQFGVFAPIGLNWNLFRSEGWSFSVYTPLVDLGSVVAFKLDANNKLVPDINWQNLISPGLYGVLNIKDLPISLGGGLQSRFSVDGKGNYAPDLRFMLFLGIDLPFFSFYHDGSSRDVREF